MKMAHGILAETPYAHVEYIGPRWFWKDFSMRLSKWHKLFILPMPSSILIDPDCSFYVSSIYYMHALRIKSQRSWEHICTLDSNIYLVAVWW